MIQSAEHPRVPLWAIPAPQVSYPFLWRGNSGAVWLRYASGSDVCLRASNTLAGMASERPEYSIGAHTDRATTSNADAWSRRLGEEVFITIVNAL